MLFQLKATPAEYQAGLDLAIATGWLDPHESGTFVRFTQVGKDQFAWMGTHSARASDGQATKLSWSFGRTEGDGGIGRAPHIDRCKMKEATVD